MINSNPIVWSSGFSDPIGRVFFIGNRIFRAINDECINEVMEFLSSELYKELRERGWIVDTKVANDVSINGYSLILEHERILFLPEIWLPFNQLKDSLKFQLKLNGFCNKYGYGLRDIGYGNVVYYKGEFCLCDLGSIRKKEYIDVSLFRDYCLPLAYLPLALYGKGDNDWLAEEMILNYDIWQGCKCVPSSEIKLEEWMKPYISSITTYEIRIKGRSIQVRTALCLLLVRILNTILKRLHVSKRIRCTKRTIEDKVPDQIDKLHLKYTSESYLPIDDSFSPSVVLKMIDKAKIDCKKIILWGNYKWDDIAIIRNNYKGEMMVMTHDRIYVNTLYDRITNYKADIIVACTNAMRAKENQYLHSLKADLLVVSNGVWEYTYTLGKTKWAENASKIVSYLLIPSMKEEDVQSSRLNTYWNLISKDNNDSDGMQLYTNKTLIK